MILSRRAAQKGAIGAIVNKDYDVSLLEDVDIDIFGRRRHA